MTRQDYMNIVTRAYQEGSFVPLFRGDEGYQIAMNRFAVGDVPTDWSILIAFGIYEFFNKTKDADVPQLCRKAIYELLKGDAYSLWCAYNTCFFFVYQEYDHRAPFKTLDTDLFMELRNKLNANCEILKATKIWQGKNLKEGLWTDIVSSAAIVKRRYGVDLV